jgi:NADH:ubiquinone oxidoreductase subunit F (NADH-binding)/(2Fe-2S) ferredoxin/Pyruvate/2-oxoacid:ferredoxin oxidoreductase delta subunit
MPSLSSPQALETLRAQLLEGGQSHELTLTMCAGTACRACGCLPVAEAVTAEIERQGLSDRVQVRLTGCHGFCEQGPLVIIDPPGIFYCRVDAADVPAIVETTLKSGDVIPDLLYTDPVSGQVVLRETDIPFYAAQERCLLADNRRLSPTSIEDYIAIGGYSALVKALALDPQAVIDEISASGLRGRGGGGYPTGKKWAQTRAAAATTRYVICNADEGDPGAYMDRSVLEGNPHSVLEGMLIGAYAIGAQKGYVYVRNEYPLAVSHIRQAIEQAREYGLLGENILGTGLSFDVKVVRGGGAFVCGESTALIASLEGEVGEPRAKDIHTVERGYLDQPTNLNNVETWANVPQIIMRGAAWFAGKGTELSKGTKVFALTGQVKNTGLVEVEMGTTLREIVFDIGGGAQNGKAIKAVQTGGPSGGCLPVSQFDLPVDYEALTAAGSMMGSGGMVVMDESACMVDVAKYFVKFLKEESCGKCTPCRLGLDRMLEILTDITEGRGRDEQLDTLKDLAWTMSAGSLCALGRTAPNPVMSTLRYFADEYEAHIKDHRCPAGVCAGFVKYVIDPDLCAMCGACADACPRGAIFEDDAFRINPELCEGCGVCVESCPSDAIGRV